MYGGMNSFGCVSGVDGWLARMKLPQITVNVTGTVLAAC